MRFVKFQACLLCFVLLAAAAPAALDQSPAPSMAQYPLPADTPASLLREDGAAGLELWKTLLGQFWIPKPGVYVIKHLQWEQVVQKVYHHPQVHVGAGDVVIDCGAHIGGFTRVALDAGAHLVVAVEPERSNAESFRRNLAAEMKSGRVKLVQKGVWDTSGKLSLNLSDVGDSHSMVVPQKGEKKEAIEVITLDALAAELHLPRVDFIKMDIEGAERNALGGAKKLLKRWRPRLAISSYHLKGDPAVLSGLVWDSHPDYLITSKDLVQMPGRGFVPKVLFFY